jgi:methylmalonyl-CoA mutase N-terminal domain/subunit
MEEKAFEYIRKLDEMGGAIVAIEKGFLQREIADSAYKYQKEIDEKERVIVGVNDYKVHGEKRPIELLRVNPNVERIQVAGIRKLRKERDARKAHETLERLRHSAEKDENLMPRIIDAVKAYATLGEICEVLRQVYGEYKELIVI